MARKTKEEAEETRLKILDAALDVFSRKGYSRTTFVDIAKQIGLTKGAVYWHFKTKTDLLVALIESNIALKHKRLGDPIEQSGSLAALRECILGSVRTVLVEPQLRKFEFFINFQIEWSEDLIEEVRTGLERVVREGPFRKYSVTIHQMQKQGLVDGSADVEKLGAILFATWAGLMRGFMLGLMSEEELLQRLRYGFDSMFKDLVKEG
ncbi:MAG: TetR family transcriptional regulator [Lentisphaerae bacterium]|nr:TetR family transcriptional regulator [Lentisphaerota bacterium]